MDCRVVVYFFFRVDSGRTMYAQGQTQGSQANKAKSNEAHK